jgi:hypothetical protein
MRAHLRVLRASKEQGLDTKKAYVSGKNGNLVEKRPSKLEKREEIVSLEVKVEETVVQVEQPVTANLPTEEIVVEEVVVEKPVVVPTPKKIFGNKKKSNN